MKRLLGSLGVLVVLALAAFVVGCGGSSKSSTSSTGTATSKSPANVNLTQGSNLKFAMVTHSDEGSFWSVVKKGAQQAAKDEGVQLIWSPSNNDPQKQAQLIAAGREVADDLGLANLDLRVADLCEFGEGEGEFDYIVVHGLYSWIPPVVRDRLMALCRERLDAYQVSTQIEFRSQLPKNMVGKVLRRLLVVQQKAPR